MLLASCLGGVVAAPVLAVAQTPATTPQAEGIPNAGSTGSNGSSSPNETTNPTNSGTVTVAKVRAEYRRLLLREKNSPSAVTELGSNQIAQVGVQGSIATLLRQAPSINVYQQGVGNNEPVISIRGSRGLETATTLDDVPTQDLLNGGSGTFLSSIAGARFNLDQISGVSIYPGVAYPDKNTFGTIGGTIAYDSLRPSPDRFVDVTGSVGSFGTYQEGITLNSGLLDGAFGTGYDAPSFLLKYSNLSTQGFIDYTAAHYNNFEFALDKPYDSGLSKFQTTILYNTANALITPEPIAVPYLQKYGLFSNYAPSSEFFGQQNDYLSIILKDRTYINPYLTVGGSLFYLPSDSQSEDYGNASIFGPGLVPGSETVNGAAPFIQVPAGFGQQNLYGPGGVFHEPPYFTYDGNAAYPPGSPACPASVSAGFAAQGLYSPCGYNSTLTTQHTDTYGVQPRITFTPPDIAGFRNTVIVGGLFAKETTDTVPTYAGGFSQVTPSAGNLLGNPGGGLGTFDGGEYRAIYQGFAQDKIDWLHNTLHVTPGVTFEATSTGDRTSALFGGVVPASVLASPYCQSGNPCLTGAYKASAFSKEWLPFLNIDYDLDRIIPAAKGTSIYGSYGESALFAPTSDFGPNTVGAPPFPSIVHLYEGGIRYDTHSILLSADYYYQHVTRDFGFFTSQSGPTAGQSQYTNAGQREFKGQELTAAWQINPNWQLFLNGSHILAKYLATTLEDVTVQEDQFGLGFKGTPISGVPAWLSTFGVDYDKKDQFLNRDELHVRFEGQYTGRQYTTTDVGPGPNGLGTNLGPLPGVPPFGTYTYYNFATGSTITNVNNQDPAFVVFNLDANYSMPIAHSFVKKLDFDLNVLNMFDFRYFQYLYAQISPAAPGLFPASAPPGFAGNSKNNYSVTPEFQSAIIGEPASVTFTVTARF